MYIFFIFKCTTISVYKYVYKHKVKKKTCHPLKKTFSFYQITNELHGKIGTICKTEGFLFLNARLLRFFHFPTKHFPKKLKKN